MDKAYVSEFAIFMNHYLEEHAEVVADQQYGWDIYWKQQTGAL